MRKYIALALISALPAFTAAQSIDVLPSIVKLKADQTVSSIQFRNSTADEATFEVKAVEEIGVGADMKRVPTKEIVVSPPIFTVKPGARQTLRFSIRTPNKASEERRYRLFAEQISGTAQHQEQGLRMMINLGIPIFVLPATETARLVRNDSDKGITITNRGNVTLQVLGLEAAGCEPVKFNRFLRPSVSFDIPLSSQQQKECNYQARLDVGLLALE